MLEEKHKKRLTKFEGRKGQIIVWALALSTLFCFIAAIIDINLATESAKAAGFTLGEVMKGWFQGLEHNFKYSEDYFIAFKRLTGAFIELGLSIIGVLVLYETIKSRDMHFSIIELLKKHDLHESSKDKENNE